MLVRQVQREEPARAVGATASARASRPPVSEALQVPQRLHHGVEEAVVEAELVLLQGACGARRGRRAAREAAAHHSLVHHARFQVNAVAIGFRLPHWWWLRVAAPIWQRERRASSRTAERKAPKDFWRLARPPGCAAMAAFVPTYRLEPRGRVLRVVIETESYLPLIEWMPFIRHDGSYIETCVRFAWRPAARRVCPFPPADDARHSPW